ncbi:MAG: hypothetical protein JO022_00980 [Acidobacteriaceae bacterium]|nr:hypothetical protein [Acidobacteriaceae bacterium]
MTPQDGPSVTRRAMDVEDYIDVLRRHKSWIFGPTFASVVIATVVAFLWPDTYLSTGVVRVVPPKVPETYVQNNVSGDLAGRFNSMLQGVLNKQHLQAIITEFDLYKKELKRMPMEDVFENMRNKDIKIIPINTAGQQQVNGRTVPAFQIGFQYYDRHIAQKVAQKIMADLINENTKEVTQSTTQTTEFLQNKRDEAKKQLDNLEARLSEFRLRNVGKMPEEEQRNFNQLTLLQTSILNLSQGMSRINQEKLVYESRLKVLKDELSQLKDPVGPPPGPPAKSERLIEKEREIGFLEAQLIAIRERYKETHPDVQSLITKLATARKQREDIVKEDAGRKPEVAPRPVDAELIRAQRDHEAGIKQIQALLDAKDMEMKDLQRQSASLSGELKTIQGRLQGLPVGLKEYEELLRERDLSRKEYEEREKKAAASDMFTALINNNQGETLEQIELASLPETPTEPKRPIIILAGFGVGLILGIFMVGAREVKDTSLKNLKDVRAYTQLPILGSIPLLENDLIVKRRRRLAGLAWATACLVGVIVMTSSVAYYYATRV